MNKSTLITLTGGLLTMLMLSATGSALAREYSIRPYQNYIDGKSKVDLTYELGRQHGPKKFRNSRLNHVDVYGEGRAKIRLYVDGKGRDTARLKSRDNVRDRVRLNNTSDAEGNWELGFHGDITIHRIVADVSHYRNQGRRNDRNYREYPYNNGYRYDDSRHWDSDKDYGYNDERGYGYKPRFTPLPWDHSARKDGWQLQQYCNCQTGKRCYIRHRNGRREVGQCIYQCPNGCKNPS